MDVYTLKRLLRNLKYIFPDKIYDIDTQEIKKTLLYSKFQNTGGNHQNSQELSNNMGNKQQSGFMKD